MSKIKIKNFGPIKEGYGGDGGFLDIKKVTVFIGNQGSGKSTIAKVIASMLWLEKALNRGDYEKEPDTLNFFHKLFGYLRLGEEYFRDETEIEYIGDLYEIRYRTKNQWPMVKKISAKKYSVPKIMYVPSERNFLSVVQKAYDVKGLPSSLFEFAEEFRRSQQELNGEELTLPIKGYRYLYDENKDKSFVIGENHRIDLLEASSGFQSIIPLYIVSNNLAQGVKMERNRRVHGLSVDQSIRMSTEISDVMADNHISEEEKMIKIRAIQAKYKNEVFINIVEEPEQNLYPTSQKEILYELLRFNNMLPGNKLIITTHSPYLISYLTLAVEANNLLEKPISKNKKDEVNSIVSLQSMINKDDLVVYELNEDSGVIELLDNYQGLPSDENLLNEMLAQGNEDFAKLLEIEQKQ